MDGWTDGWTWVDRPMGKDRYGGWIDDRPVCKDRYDGWIDDECGDGWKDRKTGR